MKKLPLKNSFKYCIAWIFIFILSLSATAQKAGGPEKTAKQAKIEMKAEKKVEKQKRKENKKSEKVSRKEAKKENIKPRYKGILKKREKKIPKSKKENK